VDSVVVVVVPIENVREKLLAPFYKGEGAESSAKESTYNAILLNRDGVVLASNGVLPVGSNLFEEVQGPISAELKSQIPADDSQTIPSFIIDKSFEVGKGASAVKIEPQIVAVSPLAVSPGRRWVRRPGRRPP